VTWLKSCPFERSRELSVFQIDRLPRRKKLLAKTKKKNCKLNTENWYCLLKYAQWPKHVLSVRAQSRTIGVPNWQIASCLAKTKKKLRTEHWNCLLKCAQWPIPLLSVRVNFEGREISIENLYVFQWFSIPARRQAGNFVVSAMLQLKSNSNWHSCKRIVILSAVENYLFPKLADCFVPRKDVFKTANCYCKLNTHN